MSSVACPHCGEPTDTFVDPGGGEHQEIIEDCVVCCRPIRFVASYSDESADYEVEAYPE
ncbi:MAG: CPXCG motif-containing cysteine-rich protein [Polyangiaceae bacterium]